MIIIIILIITDVPHQGPERVDAVVPEAHGPLFRQRQQGLGRI